MKKKKKNHIYVMKCLYMDCGGNADPVLYSILKHAYVLLALLSITGNTHGQ